MQFILTPHAPAPGGHYSQAVVANGLVFVAGQLPFDAGQPGVLPESLDQQVRQALANVEHVLKAASSALDKIVNVTIFVTDMANWPEVNRVYAEVMGEHRPARTVAVSPQLHYGCLVEIQATAVC
jgi:2-iminobutanoate/2-iminopropanoate deaminase